MTGSAGRLTWVVQSTALVALLLTSAPLAANPLDAFGWGGRAVSLGGAFTALADDSSAHFYNPAGLAQGDGMRFDLGYLYASPELEFDGGNSNVDLVKGVQGGIVLTGDVLGLHFGAGIGIFILDDRITRVRALPQQQPRFVLFDNRVQRIFLTANMAFEPFEHFHIGGGITFFANTVGQLQVEGRVSLTDVDQTVLQGAVEVNIESARYGQAGMLYAPDAPWSIGMAFRDEFFLELNLGTLVLGDIFGQDDMGNDLVLADNASFFLNSLNSNHFTPRQLVLGFAYDFGPVLVSTDFGWYQWSNFPSPTSSFTIDLDLGELDFSVPEPDPVLDPEFHDIFIPRIGVEGRAVETTHFNLLLRTGYYFEDSPTPDQTGLTNYADAAKHGISFGIGLEFADFSEVFPRPLVLDLSFLYVHMVEREIIKDDPADLVGDYQISGHAIGGSALMGFQF